MSSRLVDHRIGKTPADGRGVGAQNGIDIGGDLGLHRLQVFQDPASRPVDVGAFIKNDVDEGASQKGKSPDELDFRRREQCGGNGIGDLIFHQVGAPALPLRIDDHLRIAQVGNGVQGCRLSMPSIPRGPGKPPEER